MIITIILIIFSLSCFVISYLQFKEKGILFNNAYIFASEEERRNMDKKPHYRQSGVVFLLIGIIFMVNAIEMILQKSWLFYIVLIIAIITVIYAIASSIKIEMRYKK